MPAKFEGEVNPRPTVSVHELISSLAECSACGSSTGEAPVKPPPALQGLHADERSAARAASVLAGACKAFCGAFGDAAVEVVRSPARVNLRGMHIDNNGGYTNSICIDRETFIVFALRPPGANGSRLRLRNAGEHFTPPAVEVALSGQSQDLSQLSGWERYAAAAVRALEEVLGIADWPVDILGAVSSDIPPGAGLSSSHAFVVCLLQVLAAAVGRGDGLEPVRELRATQRAEHLAGVKSGLMDQGSMIFGKLSSLVHGRFFDLKFNEIPSTVRHCAWPEGCAVVVANSGVERKLAAGGNAIEYALPRLGCAIAMPVLREAAAARGLAVEDEYSWGAKETLELLKAVPAVATLAELLQLLPQHGEHIQAAVARLIPGGAEALGEQAFPLRGSTLFVLAESARAREFAEALGRGDLEACGRLMDVGHEGDAVDGELLISDETLDKLAAEFAGRSLGLLPGAFRAGHQRLDELCAALRAAGAAGASLTGAGRGGCAVGLFASAAEARTAVEKLRQAFPELGAEAVFATAPAAGRGLLDVRPAVHGQ